MRLTASHAGSLRSGPFADDLRMAIAGPHPGVFADTELMCIRRAIGWAWYGLGGQAGQFYLIGGPGEESCEVVRVEAEVVPGQPRRIRRHLFRTFGPVSHPAGTRVRRVTVERVFDWAQWEAGRYAEPSDSGPPDTAGKEFRPPGHQDLT